MNFLIEVWPTGSLCIWYPKDKKESGDIFYRQIHITNESQKIFTRNNVLDFSEYSILRWSME